MVPGAFCFDSSEYLLQSNIAFSSYDFDGSGMNGSYWEYVGTVESPMYILYPVSVNSYLSAEYLKF